MGTIFLRLARWRVFLAQKRELGENTYKYHLFARCRFNIEVLYSLKWRKILQWSIPNPSQDEWIDVWGGFGNIKQMQKIKNRELYSYNVYWINSSVRYLSRETSICLSRSFANPSRTNQEQRVRWMNRSSKEQIFVNPPERFFEHVIMGHGQTMHGKDQPDDCCVWLKHSVSCFSKRLIFPPSFLP